MLRLALPGCPADKLVRAPDALASVPLTEICSVGQVRLERKILAKSKSSSKQTRQLDTAGKSEEPPVEETPTLSATEFAARKLLEALTGDAQQDEWAEATDPERGLRYKVDNNTTWYRFRNQHFRSKRKRIPEADRYGDREDLNQYSSAAKWRGLLDALVENHLAKTTENARGVVLVNDSRSADFIRKLKLATNTLKKIRGLEQAA